MAYCLYIYNPLLISFAFVLQCWFQKYFSNYLCLEQFSFQAINFSSGNLSAPENSKNQLIGRFVVIDADMNDFHKFSSVENKNFVLMEDGRLYTSASKHWLILISQTLIYFAGLRSTPYQTNIFADLSTDNCLTQLLIPSWICCLKIEQ
jgi:hypothetical protein